MLLVRIVFIILSSFALFFTANAAQQEPKAPVETRLGTPSDQLKTGMRFFEGIGVPRDLSQAYVWCRRAAMTNPSKEAGYALSRIEPILSASQKAEALKALHVWFNIAGAKDDASARVHVLTLEKEMSGELRAEAMVAAREAFAAMRNSEIRKNQILRTAIISNLRRIRAAAEEFRFDNPRSSEIRLTDLIGTGKGILAIDPVDGEKYGPQSIKGGEEFFATLKDGTTIRQY